MRHSRCMHATLPRRGQHRCMRPTQVWQGLGVARLVHNEGRDEDRLIEELLRRALEMRDDLDDHIGRAETLNSLGTLKQKATHRYTQCATAIQAPS